VFGQEVFVLGELAEAVVVFEHDVGFAGAAFGDGDDFHHNDEFVSPFGFVVDYFPRHITQLPSVLEYSSIRKYYYSRYKGCFRHLSISDFEISTQNGSLPPQKGRRPCGKLELELYSM